MAWYNYLTVEIPFLFCMFGFTLLGPIMTNLHVYRTCYTLLGFNESDCSQLGNEDNSVTRWLEPKVQPTVNKINMVNSVINSSLPLIFCMFVGTWSDKFGRKPFMILCYAGLIISTAMSTVIIHFSSLSPWWFIISSIPNLMTGGVSSLMVVNSAYLNDITTEKNRVIRLGIFDVIFASSSVVGNLISPYLLYATDYQTIYLICLCLIGASFLYTIFFLSESLKSERKAISVEEILNSINIKEIVKHTIRKRENNARAYIFCIICINMIFAFPMGEMSVGTLYLRKQLHWTLIKFSRVNSITSLGNIFGTIFGTYVLYKIMKVKELSLCIFGLILQSIANILRGIATSDYYIYGALLISIFDGLPHLMIRTIMSFIIAPEEMGKIFAVLSIITSLEGMVSSLVYPLIYNATIDINSGIYNFVSFGIHILAIIAMFFLSRLTLPRYKPSQEDEQNKEQNEKRKTPSITSVNNFEVSSINERRSSKVMMVDVDMRKLSQTPSLY